MLRFSLAIVVLFAAGCVGFNQVAVNETRLLSSPEGSFSKVEVRSHNGGVTARRGPQLKIVAKIQARGRNDEEAKACLAAVEITCETRAGVLHLSGGLPKGHPRSWGLAIGFDVELETDVEWDAESHNGGVSIRGFAGDIRAVSHNGAVQIEDCDGVWRLRTHNGRVIASGRTSQVDIETHNGRIELDLRGAGSVSGRAITHNGGVRAHLSGLTHSNMELRTRNGSVSAEGAWDAKSKRGRDRLDLRAGAAGAVFHVETHNGNIKVIRDSGGV